MSRTTSNRACAFPPICCAASSPSSRSACWPAWGCWPARPPAALKPTSSWRACGCRRRCCRSSATPRMRRCFSYLSPSPSGSSSAASRAGSRRESGRGPSPAAGGPWSPWGPFPAPPSPAEAAGGAGGVSPPVGSVRRFGDSGGGPRRYAATLRGGGRLDVTVLDRDQQAADVFYRLYRRLRLRTQASRSAPLTVERAMERRALLTYATEDAGVPTPRLCALIRVGPQAADLAHLLAEMALLVGPDRAASSARQKLSSAELAAVAPLLQPVVLHRSTRSAVRRSKDVLPALRKRLLTTAPGHETAPVQLERIRLRTLVTLVASVIAAYILAGEFAKNSFGDLIRHANWHWTVAALGLSALTYVGAAWSLSGFVLERLKLVRTFLAQVAASFVTLVTPAAVGGVALNIRYLRRGKGAPPRAGAGVRGSQGIAFALHMV